MQDHKQTKTPSPSADSSTPDDPIIGIDLGTTNSLVAYCDHTGPRVLTDPQHPNDGPILPSVVRFTEDGQSIQAVGNDARKHAVEFATHTISSIKRLMGRGIDDLQNDLPHLPYQVVQGEHDTARAKIGTRIYSPQEVSAIILRELRDRAQRALQTNVRRAVITVPAYFDDTQRQATRDAGRLAGLQVLRVVNEPTAAALAYNIGRQHDDATVAVFDLGGGTFDVSILRLQQTDQGAVDQVLATAGDTHLGGDDVDLAIVQLLQEEVRQQFGQSITFPPSTRQAFRSLAEAAKIRLSQHNSTEVQIDLGDNRTYTRTITRDEFETLITPWVDRAIHACDKAITAAGITPNDIQRVILVGGSTRIPLVRQRVAQRFGTDPYTALDPDQVVAMGAAVQASILAGINRDMLLLDVIPLSLGIETVGGAVAKLITSNATIPARATEMFSTYVDNQTNIKIHVLQGERELVQDCRSLGQFELRGVPPMPAGLPKLEVTFLVDANGVLNVSAIEKRSEKAASLQIIPNHGLSREEVQRIEQESIDHAQQDMTAHRLIDLRNQARMDLRAIERQLLKAGEELEPDNRQKIDLAVQEVRRFIDADHPDPDAFHTALDHMDKSTVRLAELAIAKTLRDDPPTPS